jgi:hypothetical protein
MSSNFGFFDPTTKVRMISSNWSQIKITISVECNWFRKNCLWKESMIMSLIIELPTSEMNKFWLHNSFCSSGTGFNQMVFEIDGIILVISFQSTSSKGVSWSMSMCHQWRIKFYEFSKFLIGLYSNIAKLEQDFFFLLWNCLFESYKLKNRIFCLLESFFPI